MIQRLGDLEKRFGNDRNVRVLSYNGNTLNFDCSNVVDGKCVGFTTLSEFLANKERGGYTYHNEIVISVIPKDGEVVIKLDKFMGYANYQKVEGKRKWKTKH